MDAVRIAAGALAVALAGGAVSAVVEHTAAGVAPAPRAVTYPIRTMGSYAHIVVVTADSAGSAPAAIAARSAFVRIDSLMTNWTSISEVARINREAGARILDVHPEVALVIAASLRIWRESAGALDITVEPLVRAWGFIGGPRRVPSESEVAEAFRHVGGAKVRFDPRRRTLGFAEPGVRIDLGSIAKGYAVDVAAESLLARGVRDALVDLTGNMVAIGSPPGGDRWRIGIRDPRDRMPYFARLPLRSGEAIATSGKYEQFVAANGKTYGHIIDPRTGRPAEGLISVTVVAASAMAADGWDTPLFVLGPRDAKRQARALDNIDVVLVQPGTDGVDTVWVEKTLADRFALEPAARDSFRVEFF
jgi:thiamine biosynthesis lipoprotein